MKVLVFGGRDFIDEKFIFRVLDKLHVEYGPFTCLVEGEARGVDTIAKKWAKKCGLKVKKHPANWKLYGKAAGAIRNQEMLDENKIDLAIAFPGGRGTTDMTNRVLKKKILLFQVAKKERTND
jgi:hypothetical protein